MASHLRIQEGESDYDPTDSDEDYTENEKILLKKVRDEPSKESDNEGEVFGVGSESDDEESEAHSDLAVSDVEGQDDRDDFPDIRAWGKKKNKFYSTDYVDPDYGGFQGKDAHLAELEEEEARVLQQQLAQQLDDEDFCLDVPTEKESEDGKTIPEEIIKSDISKLSKRQKLQLLQKESPEFFGLVDDFKAKMIVAKDYLNPILQKHKEGLLPNGLAIEFVTAERQLILNYCINIYMYLLLKASRVDVQRHPVIKRLYQYRQLLSQLEPVFEEIVKPQIELILSEKEELGITEKTLKILDKLRSNSKATKRTSSENEESIKPSKKVKFSEDNVERELSDEEEGQNDRENETESGENDKRAITYQIAKNKGLTPHRKKEQRNPRVKHRNKFRKAKIRRRGAIREPRTEMSRYGGEISGIKTTVSKSIKIRS